MVVMVLMSACRVTACAIIAKCRQASGMSERDEASAAPRLTFMVLVTQVAIAAIEIIPYITSRHTSMQFITRQFIVWILVSIESLSPGWVLASWGRYAELLIAANVHTLRTASSLRYPSWVDMSGFLGWITVIHPSLIGLLIKVL